MGISKELYLKMSEEQVNQLPTEDLAYLHSIGAEWRYFDEEKRKNFKGSDFRTEQDALYKQYLKQKEDERNSNSIG